MLDVAALLFDLFLCLRVWRAVRHRIRLAPGSAGRRSEDVVVRLDGERPDPAERALLDESASDGQRRWVLVTTSDARVADAVVSGAIAKADEAGAHAVTVRGRVPQESMLTAGVAQSVAAWTGEGVDAVEFAGEADRRAIGFDDFLLIRSEAFSRIGGMVAMAGEPCRARGLVRALKRAGLRVLIATAEDGLVVSRRSLAWWFGEAVARYHSLVPAGRVGPAVVAMLVTICAIRPWVVVAREGWGAGAAAPATSLLIAIFTCAALVVHRVLFDRLTSRSSASVWTLPLGLLVTGAAAWVCAIQRLLGLDAKFRPVAPDRGPDHAAGVDYKAVYTERYFDGVDSRFSPCGFRDDNRYYERLLEPLLSVRRSGRALDVGCGYGYLTRRLARHFETTGIDVSDAAIRRCRETLPELRFEVHEVEQPFPMEEATFDVVTLTDVLEHLVEPERMLRNVHRVLADGGVLYVTTPNLNALRRWLYAEADRREHHVSLMSRADLVALLERCGFRVLESWTYVSAYMLPGRFRSSAGPETGVICVKVGAR